MSEAVPLVSVGIPTFNRVENLRRAVASVLAQDHVRLELVISDNASDDGTVEYCEELAGGDDRVRYLRNASNAGPTENFNRVRREAAGEFLLWLGDDDVLAADYISTCVRTLVERPDAALAVGAVRYEADGHLERRGEAVCCDEPTGEARVRSYFRQVGDNGTFYGVTRRRAAVAAGDMGTFMGNDWLLVACVAFCGALLPVDDTVVHRSTGGATRSLKHVAESAGFTWIEGEVPQLAIAISVFVGIGWRSPCFQTLSCGARLLLAARCAGTIVRRFVLPSIPKYLRLTGNRVRHLVRRGRPATS